MTGTAPTDQQTSMLLRAVPGHVWDYLDHVMAGVSLRDLARERECHASTILRRVRRVEQQRDDLLFGQGIRGLERLIETGAAQHTGGSTKELRAMKDQANGTPHAQAKFDKEATRILRRLCETGAVLATAKDMDMAVVVREGSDGSSTRTAVVSQELAQTLALNEWIETSSSGRILRYTITAAGRDQVKELLEKMPRTTPQGREMAMAEAPARFEPAPKAWGERTIETEPGQSRKVRYNLADSPLTALARRTDKATGQPFLSDELVRCGERLREDFELAQVSPRVPENWDNMLSTSIQPTPAANSGYNAEAAQQRVVAALQDLGPGLSDVALRCCCYLEGLESAEQRMGWAARSGKVVLRIALQQLKRHYEANRSPDADMIG